MSWSAKIVADSISPCGVRLTTVEATFPRFVLAEINTHRDFSRNGASSRAIPIHRRVEALLRDAYVPHAFLKNQRGMQPADELDAYNNDRARDAWKRALYYCIDVAEKLADIEVHKQWANRVLEPFSWHTHVITATEWQNFFNLRCHPDAQYEARKIAELIRDAMAESRPVLLRSGGWHLPYVSTEEAADIVRKSPGTVTLTQEDIHTLVKVSAARAARTSTLTHDGLLDHKADLALFEKLFVGGHVSPFEHPAMAHDRSAPPFSTRWGFQMDPTGDVHLPTGTGRWVPLGEFCGNFRAPWLQYRKMTPGEAVFTPAPVPSGAP